MICDKYFKIYNLYTAFKCILNKYIREHLIFSVIVLQNFIFINQSKLDLLLLDSKCSITL